MSVNRRDFIKTATMSAAAIAAYKASIRSAFAANNSDKLTKWIQAMRGLGPTGIPVMSSVPDPVFPNTNLYQLTVGEFTDAMEKVLRGFDFNASLVNFKEYNNNIIEDGVEER